MRSKQKLTPEKVWKLYSKGLGFNARIQLDSEVETNENFFIGKQWEGVQSNGMPTPVFNFLKRVTLFTVASVTSDNLKINASPLGNSGAKGEFYRMTNVVNNEFDSIFEHNKIGNLVREYMRNAAVDGDGCLYTYWDKDIETGQKAKGGIVTEVVENTRVFFGNPNDRRVEKQPYIILERRVMEDEMKDKAEAAGADVNLITPDQGERNPTFSEQLTDGKVTELLYFYRNKETGTIWCYDCTQKAEIKHTDMKIRRYPITWLNWDYRQDNYHGQALISGLIPNQIFVNKMFAMVMISLMTSAFPKVMYDGTRIKNWTNQVGAAIRINGGDVTSAAKIMDPAQVNPQIGDFIKLAVDYTQTFLGATPAALGDTRPDNTSAIIALQRASSTPSELTKQNLYSSVEDLGRIYLEYMGAYYGKRLVEASVPDTAPDMLAQFADLTPGGVVTEEFDFSVLRKNPMTLKLDVGASAYWSEIASMQTLDNLLMQNKIGIDDYLERVPDGYISHRQELLKKYKSQMGMAQAAAGAPAAGGQLLDSGEPMEIPLTAGNSALQRAIVETGVTQ